MFYYEFCLCVSVQLLRLAVQLLHEQILLPPSTVHVLKRSHDFTSSTKKHIWEQHSWPRRAKENKTVKLWIKYSNQLPSCPASRGAFNFFLLNGECSFRAVPALETSQPPEKCSCLESLIKKSSSGCPLCPTVITLNRDLAYMFSYLCQMLGGQTRRPPEMTPPMDWARNFLVKTRMKLLASLGDINTHTYRASRANLIVSPQKLKLLLAGRGN